MREKPQVPPQGPYLFPRIIPRPEFHNYLPLLAASSGEMGKDLDSLPPMSVEQVPEGIHWSNPGRNYSVAPSGFAGMTRRSRDVIFSFVLARLAQC